MTLQTAVDLLNESSLRKELDRWWFDTIPFLHFQICPPKFLRRPHNLNQKYIDRYTPVKEIANEDTITG
jgi:hypothetical protein